MTNEQRFIVSCESVGEAYVRQKLSGGRYSERKASWASDWLEHLESSKSDATKVEERSSRLREATKRKGYFTPARLALLFVLILGGVGVFLTLA